MHAGSIARAKANHPKLGLVLVADVAATRTIERGAEPIERGSLEATKSESIR